MHMDGKQSFVCCTGKISKANDFESLGEGVLRVSGRSSVWMGPLDLRRYNCVDPETGFV